MFLEGLEWNFDENCELVKGDYTGYYHLMETVDWQRPAYPAQVYDTFKEAALWIAEEDKSTLNKAERFIAVEPYTQRNVEGYNFSYETQDVQITDRFFGTPTERMTQLLPDLQTLESTVFLNIIVGNEPIERFDQFVEEWKAMGGDQVTEDVNAWWATI